MKSRTVAFCAGSLLLVVAALAQGGKVPVPMQADDQDFGDKIIVIVTHGKGPNNQIGGGYYEKAKIRKLGDHAFLVGKVADLGEEGQQVIGKTVWTQVADISTLTEFDNLAELKDAMAKRKAAGQNSARTPFAKIQPEKRFFPWTDLIADYTVSGLHASR